MTTTAAQQPLFPAQAQIEAHIDEIQVTNSCENENVTLLIADWNKFKSLRADIEKNGAMLGSHIYEGEIKCVFGDEYTTCSECCGAIQIEADCWSWRPAYVIHHRKGEILCRECVKGLGDWDFEQMFEDPMTQERGRTPNHLYDSLLVRGDWFTAKELEAKDYERASDEIETLEGSMGLFRDIRKMNLTRSIVYIVKTTDTSITYQVWSKVIEDNRGDDEP